MKFLMGLAAMVATIGLAAGVSAATLDTLTITGFGFAMGHPSAQEPATGTIFVPGAGNIPNAFDDSFATQVNMVMQAGTYQGSPNFTTNNANNPPTEDADLNTGVVGFMFGSFGPVAGYTASSADNDAGPLAAFSGTTDGVGASTLTALTLPSWIAGWNGATFTQGPTGGSLLIQAGAGPNGGDLLTWSSAIVGGPFNGQTGHWWMDVNATGVAVPEPMSMALVGSSIVGLIGLRRRFQA